MNPTNQAELRCQTDELLDRIQVSASLFPCATLCLFAEKMGRGQRLCINYSRLDALTIPERTAPSRIDALLNTPGNAQYFSRLDLR